MVVLGWDGWVEVWCYCSMVLVGFKIVGLVCWYFVLGVFYGYVVVFLF